MALPIRKETLAKMRKYAEAEKTKAARDGRVAMGSMDGAWAAGNLCHDNWERRRINGIAPGY